MFESLIAPSPKSRASRWTTAGISAMTHIAVLALLIVPALVATDVLPPVRETMNFFVAAPPVPPPPPPPVQVTPPKPAPAKVTTVRRVQSAPPLRPIAAAPVEAPSTISKETGAEGIASAADVQAGFENSIDAGVIGGVIGGIVHGTPPPPPPRPAAPVRVGGAITAPRLVERVEPDYPLIAQRAQIEGVVILEATVGADGRVDDVKVLRAQEVLEKAAVEAVKQWVYEPLLMNGTPQPFILTVTVSFSLAR